MLVHLLMAGRALCKEGTPNQWADGERWVDFDHRDKVTCAECLRIFPQIKIKNWGAAPIIAWTPDEWENLERLSRRLIDLLATRTRDQNNKAWQAKLRLTLTALTGYQTQ